MISSKEQYKAINARVEELLTMVDDNTPLNHSNLIELDLLSAWLEQYEEKKMPVKSPGLAETIKLRMFEKGVTQAELSAMLGISSSRLSEYLSGKAEPTLIIARKISKKLNIDADIVLGV